MHTKMVRWGILGAANIARRNWDAIRNSGNGTVTAVASRDVSRARQFVADCGAVAPMSGQIKSYDRYEAVLADSEVDAVYIPLPTGVRKEWVIRAAQAGKHVLCEKPCATSAADLQEMIDACRAHKVQFMDGVMYMHSSRLPQLRQAIDDEIGEVRRISSAFSFRGDDAFLAQNIRGNSQMEPFGCLGDLGWYCLRLALWVMKFEMPNSVTGRILRASSAGTGLDAVPIEFSGELLFANGVSSSFYCSFLTEIEQWARISGTHGLIHYSDFVLPFFGSEVAFEIDRPVFNKAGCSFNMEQHRERRAVREYGNNHATSEETNLFRNFGKLVLSGELSEYWPEIALKTQIVMEACLRSARQDGAEMFPGK